MIKDILTQQPRTFSKKMCEHKVLNSDNKTDQDKLSFSAI